MGVRPWGKYPGVVPMGYPGRSLGGSPTDAPRLDGDRRPCGRAGSKDLWKVAWPEVALGPEITIIDRGWQGNQHWELQIQTQQGKLTQKHHSREDLA